MPTNFVVCYANHALPSTLKGNKQLQLAHTPLGFGRHVENTSEAAIIECNGRWSQVAVT